MKGEAMIYLLKFGASLVLPPGIFFVCMFLLAVYLWRRKQRAAWALFAVTGFFICCQPAGCQECCWVLWRVPMISLRSLRGM